MSNNLKDKVLLIGPGNIGLDYIKVLKTFDVDKRISKEVMIDRDCWVVEIEDKNGFNPFLNLDC